MMRERIGHIREARRPRIGRIRPLEEVGERGREDKAKAEKRDDG